MENLVNQNPQNNRPALNAWLAKELSDVKLLLQEIKQSPGITTEWIPRSQVMEFFDYGDTQMASLEKSGRLVVAKVGNRKFIHRESLLKLLTESVQEA